jgi:hypothetical protein
MMVLHLFFGHKRCGYALGHDDSAAVPIGRRTVMFQDVDNMPGLPVVSLHEHLLAVASPEHYYRHYLDGGLAGNCTQPALEAGFS